MGRSGPLDERDRDGLRRAGLNGRDDLGRAERIGVAAHLNAKSFVRDAPRDVDRKDENQVDGLAGCARSRTAEEDRSRDTNPMKQSQMRIPDSGS